MDIQSILGKLDQIEAPEKLASVKLPEKMQLTEADQLRVLSGQKHILTESKKEDNLKPKEKQKAIAKKEDGKPVKESSDAQTAAREKFKAMVADKKSSKKDTKSGPAKKSVDKTDKKDKTKDNDKKTSAKKSTKKTVKESYEPKLTFKDMIRLVQESGGQQRIDPLDTELFEWANRVASTKFTDNTKKEVYAGLVYERMGGRFEMHDILSESFEEENEQDLGNEQDLEEDLNKDIADFESEHDVKFSNPMSIANYIQKIATQSSSVFRSERIDINQNKDHLGGINVEISHGKGQANNIVYTVSFGKRKSPKNKNFSGSDEEFNNFLCNRITNELDKINNDPLSKSIKIGIKPYSKWVDNGAIMQAEFVFSRPVVPDSHFR